MRKRKSGGGRVLLAKPKELERLIMPVRQALDSISAGGGLSPDECLSIEIFSMLCQQLATQKGKQKTELAAHRLSASLAQMLDEGAIDEGVLEQMMADFFNLTLMLRSIPATDIWTSLEKIAKAEPGLLR